MKSLYQLSLITWLFILAAGVAVAAPPTQTPDGEAYTVQAGDWLSKLAEKYYGDPLAYPLIVEATNAKAAEDETFAQIANPDLIEVGQKVWIPAPTAAGATPSTEGAAQATMIELAGTTWVLNTLSGESPLPETTIYLSFIDDQAAGSAGCNDYSTTYTVEGNSISFDEAIATTQKLCVEPVAAQESRYLQAMSEVATYEVSGQSLTLFDAGGNLLAEYNEQSNELSGTDWQVTGYNNGAGGVVSILAGTELTATFGEDGQLSGRAGCNEYFGPYQTDGETISIGPLGATRRACPAPEGIMEQESQYLAALETAARYQIAGNRLNMRTADGATAVNFQWNLSQEDNAAVSGLVTNMDNAAIPADATATIQLQDTSLADAPATVVGEQIIENPGPFPLAYQVAYDPSLIIDNHTYSMSARITDAEGNLLFTNDTAILVITRGNPTENVELPVIIVN